MGGRNSIIAISNRKSQNLLDEASFLILFPPSLNSTNFSCLADVAISAPYEQQTGVVYIYLGSSDGISEKYSQRIQPENFNSVKGVRGFGGSISKGVDVDGNYYNGLSAKSSENLLLNAGVVDVAVGAYASSQVVLLKSQAIMEYETQFVPLQKEIVLKELDEFAVQFCIRMISDITNALPAETDLELILDDRVTSDFYQKTINVTWDLTCLKITLKLTVI